MLTESNGEWPFPGARKPWVAEIQLCLAIWTWLVRACCCLIPATREASWAPVTAGKGSSTAGISLPLQKDSLPLECLQTIRQCTLLSVVSYLGWGWGDGEWRGGVLRFQKQTNKQLKKKTTLIETILGSNLGDNWRNWVGGKMTQCNTDNNMLSFLSLPFLYTEVNHK